MIYEPFDKLFRWLPRKPKSSASSRRRAGDNPIVDDDYVSRYDHYYSNPAFGWFAVKRLCAAGGGFPLFPEGKINWLFRAWLWQNHPDKYQNHRSIIPLRNALEIHADPSSRATRAILNAALISRDATIEAVAAALGLPCDVVAAYEAVFFNVLDRRDDQTYLANLVYPSSRLEEQLENYLLETDLDVLLLRIGYNGQLKDVLYAAGLRDNPTAGMTGAEAAALLEGAFLATGCALATSGFLNQAKMHPAIAATLELVKASSCAGHPSGPGTDGGNMGEVCAKAMRPASSGAN